MSGYIGNIPVPQATQTRQTFTATASQTTFNTAGYSPGYIDVFLNGVKLAPADYTATNGSDVVLAAGAASGDILETVAYEIFQVLDQDFTGDFTVDTDTFVVDSVNDRVGVGTASPEKLLDVDGGAIIRGRLTLGDTTEYAGGTLYQSGGNTILRAGSTADSITLFNSGSSVTYAQFTPTYSYFSQNVGIGTTSPTHKAHISTTDSTPLSVEHSDGSDVYIKLVNNADGAGNFLGASSNNLTFWTENTERMRIDSSGNVGIGTSSPASVGVSGMPALSLMSTTSGRSGAVYWQDTGGTTAASSYFFGSVFSMGTTTSHPFALKTGDTERMRIDSSGNVGIGTNSPANKLHVQSSGSGTVALFGDSEANNTLAVTRTTSAPAYIALSATSSVGGLIGGTALKFSTSAADGTSVTERMRIKDSGNVGINESSPDTKLHVSNNASQTPIATIENTASHEATIRFKSAHSAASDFRVGASISASNNFEIYSVDAATSRLAINSGGDVAIGGTSTSVWNGAQGRKFIVSGPNNTIASLQSSTTSTNQGAILEAYSTTVTSGSPALGSVAFLRENTSNTSLSSATTFYTNYGGSVDERMRITSSGAVAIGDTNPTRHGQATKALIYNGSGTASEAALHCSRGGTSNEFQIAFSNAYGVRGTITTTSGAVSYNTTSDYRLKENVTDVTDGITRVKQLAPKRFNFIVNPDVTVDGFLAHEAQAVVPEAVTGTQDAMCDEEYEVTPAVLDDDGNVVTEAVMGTRSVPDYQGIDQSKLVPLLTAALQEAISKIETLETEMTSVKARLDALEAN